MRRLFIILLLIPLLFSCKSKTGIGPAETFFSMGTVCTLRLPDGTDKKVTEDVITAVTAINDRFSRTATGSEINTLNKEKHTTVSDECLALLQQSLSMADRTNGAFDPAIGGLTALWDISGTPRIPSKEEIKAVDTDWKQVRIEGNEVTIPQEMDIDLGGIAKGYAADKTKEILGGKGIVSALINYGGNVYAIGHKKDGTLWKIGLRDPDKGEGEPFLIISLADRAVVTSGGYERFFVAPDGKTYHHILDRETGYPAESDLLSASIIGEESAICDALSTAVFVLGSEKGLELLQSFPDYAAVVLTKDREIKYSKDFPYTVTTI